MSKSVSIIGAGSIGICTALHLQQSGWQVTLIDRKAPASETSFGNAGIINSASLIALNSPAMHRSLASLLKNNKPQLRYNLAHIAKSLPWALAFLKQSKTRAAEKTSEALHSLTSVSLQEHKALMQRAGNMHRLSEKGWLRVYRKEPGFDDQSFEAQQFRKYNIPGEKLTADDVKDLEPSLKPIYASGYLLSGAASINNPGDLLKEYAQLFVNDGGTIVNATITGIDATAERIVCRTNETPIQSDKLVIAAGPWSNDILGMLRYSVLMNVERGYHTHYNLLNNASLERSVFDVQSGFIMSPMEMGLRITTGVELNERDAPNNLEQLNQVLPSIKQAIDLGEQTDMPIWRGSRPTLPDSRPIIGKAPKHDNVWMAFGHQHIGLMTGPITGKLLAAQMNDEQTELNMEPFAPKRYVSSRRQ
jgi:D-amino-acid dehydrogenase